MQNRHGDGYQLSATPPQPPTLLTGAAILAVRANWLRGWRDWTSMRGQEHHNYPQKEGMRSSVRNV